jgi:hypothetical protein
MRRVNHHMSAASREYQARITGFPPYHEWSYMSVDFDGFRPNTCTLQETKARYEQFLDPATNLTTWRRWFQSGFLSQALKQNAVAVPKPRVSLQWFFMEHPVYILTTGEFARAGLPIICIHQS